MRNCLHIIFAITTRAEQFWNAREVSDGFEISRGLLAAESAIEVRADAGMTGCCFE